MPKQLTCEALPRESNEHDLKSGGTGELHRRQTIGVASDQNDPVYGPIVRIRGNVEANAHIDTFLFKPWFEVVVRHWP